MFVRALVYTFYTFIDELFFVEYFFKTFFLHGSSRQTGTNSSTHTRTKRVFKVLFSIKKLILALTFSSFQPEADFSRNSSSSLSCITGDDQIQGESDDIHKFIHRRLMPSLHGFLFVSFIQEGFAFIYSFRLFFLFREVLFLLFK